MLTKTGPLGIYNLPQTFDEVTGGLHISSLRTGRLPDAPEPFSHSLYIVKLFAQLS